MANEVAIIETRATQLAEKIEVLVTEARKKIASVANTAQVYTYYEIGRYIIEDEQGGKVRAEYGKGVLKRVSERLTERLGKGWSEENLRLMRKFYTLYSHRQSPINKIQTSGLEIQSPKIQTSGSEISHSADNRNHGVRNYQFVLPWAHYLILTHVSDPDARSFYEIEAFKQHTCGPYADDCRKPDRRERYNGKSSGKPDQPAELKEKGVSVWGRKNI